MHQAERLKPRHLQRPRQRGSLAERVFRVVPAPAEPQRVGLADEQLDAFLAGRVTRGCLVEVRGSTERVVGERLVGPGAGAGLQLLSADQRHARAYGVLDEPLRIDGRVSPQHREALRVQRTPPTRRA